MKKHLFCGLLLLVFAHQVLAQSPAGPGRVPLGSYFNGGIDSINLHNGNVMVDLPLISRPGRELSTGLHLFYNSQGWKTGEDPIEGPYGYYDGGWRFNVVTAGPTFKSGAFECDWHPDPGIFEVTAFEAWLEWTDGTGAMHIYEPASTPLGQYFDSCDFYEVAVEFVEGQGGTLWFYPEPGGADNSKVRYTSNGDFLLVFADGSVLNGSQIVGRNGNYLPLGDPTSGLQGEDTLGRTIGYSTGGSESAYYKQYTVTDANGDPQTYQLNYTVCTSKYNPIDSGWECINDLLDSVELPNGRSYEFEYDHEQGFLTEITLPSGATITFDFPGGNSNHTLADNYVVARHVDDGVSVSDWTYARSDVSYTRTVTVTYPEVDGPQGPVQHVVEHDFHITGGQEQATRWRNTSSATPSQVVLTTYQGGGFPWVIETQRGSKTQTRTQTWSYLGTDGYYLTQEDQSDWYSIGGSAAPLTRTVTSYTPTFPRVVTQVELKKWDAGTSAYVTEGKTVYEHDQYEQYPLSVTSNVPHKSTPEFARRNVTTIRSYSDATNYLEEHFYYDDLGNVVQQVDARSKTTTISYADNFSDSTNRNSYAFPTLVTNAKGHETETVYHYETGLPVSVEVEGILGTTTFTYDEMNRPDTIEEENGRVTEYDYEDNPQNTLRTTVEVTVSSGVIRKTETFVDLLYRPIRVTRHDPAGNVSIDTEYDGKGQVKRVSTPFRGSTVSAWTASIYDVLGRPLTVTNADSTTVAFDYDGNTVTTTDEAGNSRRQTINGLGQLTKVEEPDPDSSGYLETAYSYYVVGPLKQVTQGSQTRTFNHDWLGRRISEVHPETGETEYTYDGFLVATREDARGISTDYTYDDIGRPLTVTYSDSTPDVTYTYDQNNFIGFVTSVDVDGVTASTFEYNSAGGLAEENVTIDGVSGTFTTGYTYDLDGRLLTMTYPSGRVVTHSYADSGGIASDRTDTLVDSTTSTTLVNSVTDNAAGAITARTLGGTITETRSFNSRNQLTGIAADTSSGTLMNIEYGYGANNDGRIRSRTDAVQPEHSASYTFDEIGRLTAVSGGDSSWGISWALDRYGNRQSQTPSGLASGRVGTQTTASYTNNKFSGFTYDAAGNLTDDGPNTYTYDAENRLIQINSSENQYAYDYAGRRVKRTTGGVTTYYFYGLTGLTSEFSTETGVTGAASTNRLQFRVGEQTGTSVMLTDSGGVPRENNRVFPFGEPWLALAGSTNNEKFTTYQHDNDAGTDLDYAMARYYASRSGRFMTPDPEHIGANIGDPQSWNAYTYAFVDPINFTDPTGLCPPETDDKSDCPKSLLAQLLTGIVGGKWGAGSPSTLGSCFDVETLGECVAQMLKMASKEAGQNTAKVSAPAVTRQGTTTPRAPTRGLLGVAPWQGSIFLPFRGKFGFGLEVNATYLPKSNEVCLGGGLGAGGFGLSGGPLVSGNTKSPEKVVMGASLGVAVQLTPFRGAQGIVNSSGALAGPTVGTSPGVSVTYTYTPESLCVDVPSW